MEISLRIFFRRAQLCAAACLLLSWPSYGWMCDFVVANAVGSKVAGIVDPFVSGKLIAPEAKKRNWTTIALPSGYNIQSSYKASMNRGDYDLILEQSGTNLVLEDRRRGHLSREIIAYGVTSGSEVRELTKNFVKEFGVDLLIPGMESAVRFTENTAFRLGLPSNDASFIDMNNTLIDARRNKRLMGEVAERAGIPVAPQISTSNPRAVIAWADRIVPDWRERGLVLKPEEGRSSHLVKVRNTEEGVFAAFDEILWQETLDGESIDTILVQPRLQGAEYALNFVTVTIDGKTYHFVTDVWRYYKTSNGGEAPLYGHEKLLRWNEIPAGLVEYSERVLNALGFRIGASHLEAFMTPDGPRLVEVGGRLYGAENPRIAAEATGYGQVEALLDAYENPQRLLEKFITPYDRRKHTYTINIAAPKTDQPLYFDFEAYEKMKDELRLSLFSARLNADVKRGQALKPTTALYDNIIEFGLSNIDPFAIERAFATIGFGKKGLFKTTP